MNLNLTISSIRVWKIKTEFNFWTQATEYTRSSSQVLESKKIVAVISVQQNKTSSLFKHQSLTNIQVWQKFRTKTS